MNVEIICPLYNAENYIEELYKNIIKQKDVEIKKISFILTQSKDNSEKILNDLKLDYDFVQVNEFSHSLSRENVAIKSEADILVFITQDIDIRSDKWLKNLILPIEKGESEAAFSRQITKYNNIEKYTREKNYPENSYVVQQSDVEKIGLRAFFFSDASSAIKTDVFKSLNGYDKKRLPTNEDQYIAYKLITNGYRIKYCADSVVYHSHNFTLKQVFNRYYATGLFYRSEKHMNQFKTNKTGGGLAIYILKRAIKERNYKVIIRWFPDMLARFLGMKIAYVIGDKNNGK